MDGSNPEGGREGRERGNKGGKRREGGEGGRRRGGREGGGGEGREGREGERKGEHKMHINKSLIFELLTCNCKRTCTPHDEIGQLRIGQLSRYIISDLVASCRQRRLTPT